MDQNILTINKVKIDLIKKNQGNEATREKSMAITKLDEAIQWLMKSTTDALVHSAAIEVTVGSNGIPEGPES